MGLGIKTRLFRWYTIVFRFRLPAVRWKCYGDTSQHGEFLWLRHRLDEGSPCFIVDVGANDGKRNSNSYPFIAQGWSGILVEPIPSVFAKLKALYQGNQRVHMVNCACARQPGKLPLFLGKDGEIGEYATLSTEDSDYYRQTRTAQQVEVEVDTLTTVLEQNNCPRDFGILSVDTEGFDYEVLASLDFSRFKPRVIVTEDENTDDEQKFALLKRNGYTFSKRFARNSLWRLPRLRLPGPGKG